MSGVRRVIHNKINRLLENFPVVIILGSRQVGKTYLSKQLRAQWKYFDLENEQDYERIARDVPFFFKEHPEAVIIDEAQELPRLFKTLRGVIDQNRDSKGRFILTGSSSHDLIEKASDSLAGRVALVELGTLKGSEIFSKDLSPIYSVFNNKLSNTDLDFFKNLKPVLTTKESKYAFLKGGYPEPVLQKNALFYNDWMNQYFQSYINRDIRSLFPRLNHVKFRRFIKMLASLNGQLVNKAELGRSLEISESTASDYLDIAHSTYFWRNYHTFERDQTKSLIKTPRGGFRDSGVAHSLLRIFDQEQLERYPYVGRSFENYCCEEIIKGLEASEATHSRYHYFRTKNKAEIDLILDGSFGTLPIEIKYGVKSDSRRLATLKEFVKRHKLPYGILVNNADCVEMLTDSIIQIPITFF